MKNALIGLVAWGLFLLASSATWAADDAVSSPLPAALQALQVEGSQLVSAGDAEEVRGQGGSLYWVAGVVYSRNYVFQGTVGVAFNKPALVNITLMPYVFSFEGHSWQ